MTSYQNPNILNIKNDIVNFPKYKTPQARVSNGARNSGPISLKTDGGLSTIAGYSPFILRPHLDVSVPRDITRNGIKTSCDWPSSAGSKYQEWCNPDVASDYYMMRENMAPRTYDQILQKMFNKVVKDSTGLDNTVDIKYNSDQWNAVDCGSGTNNKDVMSAIMTKIAIAVSDMPEMHHNGTYKYEQFHYTDPIMYKVYSGPADAIFYHVLFNLYNALRSVSSAVYATVQVKNNDIAIYRFAYVNDKMWTATDDEPGSGIENFNIGPVGNKTSITLPHSSLEDPTEIEWLYGNTILHQEFNKHGFYNADTNLTLGKVGVPDSLKERIRTNEKYNSGFLFEPGNVGYTGLQPTGPMNYKLANNNGKPHTITSIPTVIYGSQLVLDGKNHPILQGKDSIVPVIGFIN